jgi:hypothetical protein
MQSMAAASKDQAEMEKSALKFKFTSISQQATRATSWRALDLGTIRKFAEKEKLEDMQEDMDEAAEEKWLREQLIQCWHEQAKAQAAKVLKRAQTQMRRASQLEEDEEDDLDDFEQAEAVSQPATGAQKATRRKAAAHMIQKPPQPAADSAATSGVSGAPKPLGYRSAAKLLRSALRSERRRRRRESGDPTRVVSDGEITATSSDDDFSQPFTLSEESLDTVLSDFKTELPRRICARAKKQPALEKMPSVSCAIRSLEKCCKLHNGTLNQEPWLSQIHNSIAEPTSEPAAETVPPSHKPSQGEVEAEIARGVTYDEAQSAVRRQRGDPEQRAGRTDRRDIEREFAPGGPGARQAIGRCYENADVLDELESVTPSGGLAPPGPGYLPPPPPPLPPPGFRLAPPSPAVSAVAFCGLSNESGDEPATEQCDRDPRCSLGKGHFEFQCRLDCNVSLGPRKRGRQQHPFTPSG